MAVTWSWSEKLGSMEFTQKHEKEEFHYTLNLYCGNCLAAIIYEFKDQETGKDMYQFNSFWNDKDHLKNCLGLSKDFNTNIYNNEYNDNHLDVIRLNTYYEKDAMTIAKLFVKARHKVELYYEVPVKKDDVDE